MNFLDENGLSRFLDDSKEAFAYKTHTHDDVYYTETEIDNKLNGKANSSHNHSAANITSGTLPIARGGTGATTAAGALSNLGVTATASELNYMDGVTSNVQTQLNGKSGTGHTHNYAGSSSAGGSATLANAVYGAYDTNGGKRAPNAIGTYKVDFHMGNEAGDGYQDWIHMNSYCWADVPYATMIGVKKAATPCAYIASGGNSSNVSDWKIFRLLDSNNYTNYAADKSHNHDSAYAAKSHTHDDRYYTESEMDSKLDGKASSSHTHNYAGSSSAGGSATSAVKLANARTIFGKSFDGTGNVAGQPLVYGTYTSTASIRYSNSGIQIRENGLVGDAQSDIGYAPSIGFHWSGKIAATMLFHSDGNFYLRKQNGTDRASLDANLIGNANTATILATARTIQTNLASTSSASFNGSANITPGVTGTLPVANGGTGGTTAAAARTNLGALSATNANSYWGMGTPDGTTNVWIRTTSLGIIPYQSGGSSALGTSSWPFNNAYITTVYGSLSGNATTATTSGTCTGNSATATKLQTARTINVSGAAGGTATSFDGSANISVPINSFKEAYLSWGGKNFSSSYGCIDAAMIPELNANRLAFVKPAGVTIEYSRDSGSTWTSYGSSDVQKSGLFTGVGCAHLIGKADSTNKATAAYQLRVTVNATSGGIYSQLNKFCLYVSTNGSTGTTCTIQAALKSSPSTYVTFANAQPIGGWSGYNIINTNMFTFGSNNDQYNNLRFIFKSTGGSSDYNGLQVISIQAFGGVGWGTPSNMAKNGHLYTYDISQNATFPANVTATTFVGALSGNAATATKLGTANKGSATQPIYLAAGVPTACTYTLSKSVPSDAKFTDTTYSAATKTANGLMSSADKSKLDLGGIPIVTTAGTGAAYTATVDGMTSLVNGMKITVIPHTSCTTVYFTLNVNSLGAKSVFRRKFDNSSHMYQGSSNWFESGAPVTLTYNGTAGVWLADATDAGTHDHMASEIRDTIPITKGGTGATTAAAALTNLGITATAAELNKMDGITATTAELNYCDGVTSNIQTQLNGKSGTSHTHSQYAASSHTHSYLPLSGGTLSGTSYGTLNIKNTNANNSSGNASIKFENGNGVLGYIGMDGYADGGLKIYSADTNSTNIILDSSNYYAHIDELSDSGWKNATLSSSFTLYNSSSKVRYRELNKVVHIEGVVKPTATLEGSNDNVTIFTLPSGYRPSSSQYFICQGSGTNRWLMTITSGGVVGFSRYSNGTSNASASTSTWLPFSATFFID